MSRLKGLADLSRARGWPRVFVFDGRVRVFSRSLYTAIPIFCYVRREKKTRQWCTRVCDTPVRGAGDGRGRRETYYFVVFLIGSYPRLRFKSRAAALDVCIILERYLPTYLPTTHARIVCSVNRGTSSADTIANTFRKSKTVWVPYPYGVVYICIIYVHR